jgi:hypothetical protein
MRVSLEVYAFNYPPVNITVDERQITLIVHGSFNRPKSFSTKASKEPALSELI